MWHKTYWYRMTTKTNSAHPHVSLSEVHDTIDTTRKATRGKRILAFLGPAYLVSVGYMDPELGDRFSRWQQVWLCTYLGVAHE